MLEKNQSTLPPELSCNHLRSSWYHHIDDLDIDVMKSFVPMNPNVYHVLNQHFVTLNH